MTSPKKVLIGEDSSVIQNLTKKILEFQNFKIFAAKNGKEVLKALSQESFDIVLLDINMPQMDGMTCAREIRSKGGEQSNIPLVAITGNARNYSEKDFQDAGFNEYLQKPLDFDKLVEVVKKYTL